MIEKETKAAGLGALTYQASVLEAYMSLGLVTAVGPPHDRSAYTLCFQRCDELSVVEWNTQEQATLWRCFTASSQQQFSCK